MPIANVNGLRLHYQTSGSGPRLIIIHGFTSNSAFWYLTIVPWLAREFQILTYDLRGHGKSEMPKTGYTSADMAEDLLGLMDHLDIRRAHLIGHSFGGEIALQAAIRCPRRVSSLVLADARVRALQPVQMSPNGTSWTEIRQKLQEMGVEVPAGNRDEGQNFWQELAASPWPAMWNPQNRNAETFGPMGLGRYRPRSVQHWVQLYCNTSAGKDLTSLAGITDEKIRGIAAPVLAVYGDRSGFLPTMRRLSRMLPYCQTRLVPGVGHLLPVVVPGVFVKSVQAFLGGLQNGRRTRTGAP